MNSNSTSGPGNPRGVLFFLAVIGVTAGLAAVSFISPLGTIIPSSPSPTATPQGLGAFETYSQLQSYMAANAGSAQRYSSHGIWFGGPGLMIGGVRFMFDLNPMQASIATFAGATPTFTGTNVQVQGVDEPDRVKTDGTHLFVSTTSSVAIINAYPPNSTATLSTISLKAGTIQGLEVREGHLLVIAQRQANVTYVDLLLYDISNLQTPRLTENYSMAGTYLAARLASGFAYAIVQQPSYTFNNYGNATALMPAVTENGSPAPMPPTQVYHTQDRAQVSFYTVIVSMSMATGKATAKSVLTGPSSTVYVSTSSIYVVYTNYQEYYADGIPGDIYTGGMITASNLQQGANSTVVRASYSNGTVSVEAAGSIPGTVLNQFSLDEYGGYFRAATSRFASVGGAYTRSDDVYVLNLNMSQAAVLSNIAPGENIYAVRFVGETGYVVTFEQIDPLFTISFKDPTHPEILSALKSMGYSNYLHPLPGGLLIGVGKDAVPSSTGSFAWYLGLKLSLYHIFDNGTSVEVARLGIGDRGTDSPVLSDHLAFTYDSSSNITVIPVMLTKVNGNYSTSPGTPPPYGDPVWQGVYVIRVTPKGFTLLGRVSQYPAGLNYGDSPDSSLQIDRSAIIGGYLYTISQGEVLVSDLSTFGAVATVKLPS